MPLDVRHDRGPPRKRNWPPMCRWPVAAFAISLLASGVTMTSIPVKDVQDKRGTAGQATECAAPHPKIEPTADVGPRLRPAYDFSGNQKIFERLDLSSVCAETNRKTLETLIAAGHEGTLPGN